MHHCDRGDLARASPALLATLLRAAADALEAGALDVRADGDEWIAQARSPLGRKAHCALVRSGALPGCRVGRKVLVRRRDLDAYIEAHAVSRSPSPNGDSAELSLDLRQAGFR